MSGALPQAKGFFVAELRLNIACVFAPGNKHQRSDISTTHVPVFEANLHYFGANRTFVWINVVQAGDFST